MNPLAGGRPETGIDMVKPLGVSPVIVTPPEPHRMRSVDHSATRVTPVAAGFFGTTIASMPPFRMGCKGGGEA